jgi:hypothetical protein
MSNLFPFLSNRWKKAKKLFPPLFAASQAWFPMQWQQQKNIFFPATKKCPTNKRRFLWVQFLITLLFNISESCNLVNHHWTRQTVKSVKRWRFFVARFLFLGKMILSTIIFCGKKPDNPYLPNELIPDVKVCSNDWCETGLIFCQFN